MIAVVVGDQGVALLHRIQHVIVVDIVEQRSVEAPRRERPVVGILRGADGQTGGQADQRKLHLKKKQKKIRSDECLSRRLPRSYRRRRMLPRMAAYRREMIGFTHLVDAEGVMMLRPDGFL